MTVTSRVDENTIEWLNPPEQTYVFTRILGREDAPPTGPNDPLATFRIDSATGAGEHGAAMHGGLDPDTPLYYAAFVNHTNDTFSPGKTIQGRTLELSSPILWSFHIGILSLRHPASGRASTRWRTITWFTG